MNYLPIRRDAMTKKTNSSVNPDDHTASKPVAVELTPVDHKHMRDAILEGINGKPFCLFFFCTSKPIMTKPVFYFTFHVQLTAVQYRR